MVDNYDIVNVITNAPPNMACSRHPIGMRLKQALVTQINQPVESDFPAKRPYPPNPIAPHPSFSHGDIVPPFTRQTMRLPYAMVKTTRQASGNGKFGVRPFRFYLTSKLCVRLATQRMVAATEQYFSSDRAMARSTFCGSKSSPSTM